MEPRSSEEAAQWLSTTNAQAALFLNWKLKVAVYGIDDPIDWSKLFNLYNHSELHSTSLDLAEFHYCIRNNDRLSVDLLSNTTLDNLFYLTKNPLTNRVEIANFLAWMDSIEWLDVLSLTPGRNEIFDSKSFFQ